MKGPAGRIKFDIRRVWECPACHRREWSGGEIVTRLCYCTAKGNTASPTWMKLIEPDRHAPAPAAPHPEQQPPDTPACDTPPLTGLQL